jgi:hypothetical protein
MVNRRFTQNEVEGDEVGALWATEEQISGDKRSPALLDSVGIMLKESRF